MISDVVVADARTCSKCKEAKPLSSFCKKGGTRKGYQCWCKPCVRAYYKAKGPAYNNQFQNRRRAAKQQYVRAIKTAHGCAECGERRDPCLEFHHTDPSQKLAGVWKLAASNATYARLNAEIAKCVVLCANCHRVHHHNERQAKKRTPHNGVLDMKSFKRAVA